MSYVSIPFEFNTETGECRSCRILSDTDGEMTPVAVLRGDKGLPVDLRQLSQNLASVLNGNDPLFPSLGGTHNMHFAHLPAGMSFRFRDPVAGGVSEPLAILAVHEGFDLGLGAVFAEDGIGMKFMAAAQSRTAGTDARAHTPKAAPPAARPAF